MKIGIVVFPGSNCEQDCLDAVTQAMGAQGAYLWHDETDLCGVDAVLLPGGFSYGDYLRSGALARFSPVLRSVRAFAEKGGPVLGICNGFQILCECGLLPGALVKNRSLRFQCQDVAVEVCRADTPFTNAYSAGQVLRLPIAHAEGNYYAPPETIQALEANGQVIFRYQQDVNGSVGNIAGICNEKRNVVGLMPHPERNLSAQPPLWNGDGAGAFESLKRFLLKSSLASL
ncbi:MAG: phosphoribosylformylglycinamidine synthase subunit PurQ [Vampirovibrionales bacterium]|nr:phosphoribosylformylglycinamidine synthase subunit PurQ [Vampirovibrionales bacterium]